MLRDLQDEISSRITATQRFAQATCRQRPGDDLLASQVARGMVWVQLYAIWEYTIIHAVREAILQARTHEHTVRSLKPEVLSIVLDNRIKSALDSRDKTVWANRIALFVEACCDQIAKWDENVFPTDGSHFRKEQVQTIWAVFGISEPIVPNQRHLGLIDNMVDFRNEIAHGRETPESIGSRFSADDMMDKVAEANELCLYVADTIIGHCTTGRNLCR
jgi:hypothetical protein